MIPEHPMHPILPGREELSQHIPSHPDEHMIPRPACETHLNPSDEYDSQHTPPFTSLDPRDPRDPGHPNSPLHSYPLYPLNSPNGSIPSLETPLLANFDPRDPGHPNSPFHSVSVSISPKHSRLFSAHSDSHSSIPTRLDSLECWHQDEHNNEQEHDSALQTCNQLARFDPRDPGNVNARTRMVFEEILADPRDPGNPNGSVSGFDFAVARW